MRRQRLPRAQSRRSSRRSTGTALSDTQLRVIDTVKVDFDAQRPGLAYSDGVEEPWCADFVSAVMHDAGHPLVNPNSGHWRIRGVYTLQEYFQSIRQFEPPSYRPRPGDVALYGEGSPLGLHTNIVLAAEATADGTATRLATIGGNEDGGIRGPNNRHRPGHQVTRLRPPGVR